MSAPLATKDAPCSPVNEAQLVHGLDGEHTFRDVETSDIFREGVVLDQHRHEIASRQELHDKVDVPLGTLFFREQSTSHNEE